MFSFIYHLLLFAGLYHVQLLVHIDTRIKPDEHNVTTYTTLYKQYTSEFDKQQEVVLP